MEIVGRSTVSPYISHDTALARSMVQVARFVVRCGEPLYTGERHELLSERMRLLAGCITAAGVLLAAFALFIARIRLYDSVGEYKGVGNIGTAPIYLLTLATALIILAWLVWRKRGR